MGLFSKSNANKDQGVHIEFNDDDGRQAFVAGQSITGTLTLTLDKEVECKRVVIHFEGKEKVIFYDPKSGGGTTQQQYFHTIMSDDYPIADINSTLKPGKHTFPFNINTPNNLPASCDITNGRIRYRLTGTVERTGAMTSNMTQTYDVTIFEHPRKEMQPVSESTSKEVKAMFMFGKGNIEVSASLPRNIYETSEKPMVEVTVKNDSSKGARKIKIQLRRTLITNRVVSMQENRKVSKTTKEVDVEGVGAGKTETRKVAIDLDLPSSHGSLCRIEYAMRVVVDMPFSGNSHVDLPIEVVGPGVLAK